MTTALLLAAILAQQGIAWDDDAHPWIAGSEWVLYSQAAVPFEQVRVDWFYAANNYRHRTLKIYPHRWIDRPAGETVNFCVAWGYYDPDYPLVWETTGFSCYMYQWPAYCNLNTGEGCPWTGDRLAPGFPGEPE